MYAQTVVLMKHWPNMIVHSLVYVGYVMPDEFQLTQSSDWHFILSLHLLEIVELQVENPSSESCTGNILQSQSSTISHLYAPDVKSLCFSFVCF